MQVASAGYPAGLLHVDSAKEDVPLMVRLDRASRSDLDRLQNLNVMGRSGRLVALRELVKVTQAVEEKSIYHKNLMPVTYVTGDVAGAMESPVYAILKLGPEMDKFKAPEGYAIEQHMAALPTDSDRYSMKWDGEWHITYEVFRDLGIACAGIVVRNSIILVDFVELRLQEGMALDAAVIDAGAVRFRPMLLTAAAVVVGAGIILFDPIFQGLAIALMAGEVASLALSRMTVPIVYFVVNRRRKVVCPSNVISA